MNTRNTSRPQTLAAGQVLAGRAKHLILIEGELRVQAPAQWLADRVVFPPAIRVTAPAELSLDGTWTVLALGPADARVVTREEADWLAGLESLLTRAARACDRVVPLLRRSPRHR